MEGKTHGVGGTVVALTGFIAMKESANLLSPTVMSPALQFLLIYSSGMYGGLFPDNDHHWGSSPLNDPASWVSNKILHAFNKPYKSLDERLSAKQKRKSIRYKLYKFLACKHRSWQTHSEFTLLVIYLAMTRQLPFVYGLVDGVVWQLILTGFGLGVISHILLDMLTTEGCRFALGEFIITMFPNVPMFKTIRLVPPSETFKTGSDWEMTIRKLLNFVQYILILIVVLYIFKISVPQYLMSFINNIRG